MCGSPSAGELFLFWMTVTKKISENRTEKEKHIVLIFKLYCRGKPYYIFNNGGLKHERLYSTITRSLRGSEGRQLGFINGIIPGEPADNRTVWTGAGVRGAGGAYFSKGDALDQNTSRQSGRADYKGFEKRYWKDVSAVIERGGKGKAFLSAFCICNLHSVHDWRFYRMSVPNQKIVIIGQRPERSKHSLFATMNIDAL